LTIVLFQFGRNVVDGQYSAATSTLTTAKDSESEFGSLSSVRIDEDDDSCLGQKPASVVIAQTPDIDNRQVSYHLNTEIAMSYAELFFIILPY
jgi:hypothetical protein